MGGHLSACHNQTWHWHDTTSRAFWVFSVVIIPSWRMAWAGRGQSRGHHVVPFTCTEVEVLAEVRAPSWSGGVGWHARRTTGSRLQALIFQTSRPVGRLPSPSVHFCFDRIQRMPMFLPIQGLILLRIAPRTPHNGAVAAPQQTSRRCSRTVCTCMPVGGLKVARKCPARKWPSREAHISST
jgi:hypothetical protein